MIFRYTIWICVLALVPLSMLLAQNDHKPNVLFIAVDDLTTTLASYDDPIAVTPNFDRLARLGVQFNHAYCQIPLCNPSRASVMTGLRPDSTGVFDLKAHFRDNIPDVVTMPELFKNNGYWVGRIGKIYHYNVPASIGTNGLDDAVSWTEVFNPKGRDKDEEHLVINAEPHRKISAALSWLPADGLDNEQTDGMIASEAVNQIRNHKNEPFFLAVGFFRPHTPYIAPRQYFDLYPIETISLPPTPKDDREDIPYAALAHNCKLPHYGLPDSVCLEAKQAYYASVSYIDAQLGILLDELEQNQLLASTIIVLWSDHGYHLGEHNGIWQKRTLFEQSAGAPFYIYNPVSKGNGQTCDQIVEFIDIYPTLADLCGLNPTQGLPGKSLKTLLDQPDKKWNGQAYTQVLRPGDGSPVMGRSIRTDRWRYTEWNEGKEGRELYHHFEDPYEFYNLAGDSTYHEVMLELRNYLDKNVSGKVPVKGFDPESL